ncbi:MAG: hypothetical protein KBG07_06805 [Elusimicrobia bacterium]|nr:hypothetical protein [Elusimicrobiota bacterium]
MKTSEDRLFAVASLQQGFFTSKQARAAGFVYSSHSYHVKRGNWVREHWGIYRLTRFAAADRPDLVLWSLWSRDRKKDVAQGVYSHQTALTLYELSDVMPSKLHMTVPRNFHRGDKIPDVLVLHKAKLHQNDIDVRAGYQVTKPLRTLADLMDGGSLSKDHLNQSVTDALQRGLINRKEIETSLRLSDSVRKELCSILKERGR